MPINTASLKQRLASLTSLNISNGSESYSGPGSPSIPKWRPFFNRRNTEDGMGTTFYGQDQIQEVMTRLIFQAGVDYETRPMVVMNASALPDPKEVSYDLLLSRILAYLSLYVESDYTVVFFAAGGRHTPGWNWVWKAYRSLSRKYRKNLKRLFIVHSNFFTKMLFSLAGAIISPKFFRKITYIDTLSDLATQVPLTQIDIPPAVYKENLKYEQHIQMPILTCADMFGVPLAELMGYDGEKGGVPRVVKDCVQYLRDTGLRDEGLFRRSPSSAMLKYVQEAYDRGQVVSLDTFADPHLAAVLLKKYLRDLPEPLFPASVYPVIHKCPMPLDDAADMSGALYIRDILLPELPLCNYILLSHIMHLLHDTSQQASFNSMDAYNLAIVVCPNLIKSADPLKDVAMCMIPGTSSATGLSTHPALASRAVGEGKTTLGSIIQLCIQRYYEIFDELLDRAEARPAIDIPEPTSNSSPFRHARSTSHHSSRSNKRDSTFDDDEDIDDAMLVMPIGPSTSGSRVNPSSPPSAWAPGAGPTNAKYKPRHRNTNSRDSKDFATARSTHTTGGVYTTSGFATAGKAKSMISIEKGGPPGTARRGSIAVGRGTTRKGSGSGVEALGVTASGFFSPVASAPPVPQRPRQ